MLRDTKQWGELKCTVSRRLILYGWCKTKDLFFRRMAGLTDLLISFRISISCLGIFGNVFVIFGIIQTQFSRLKSFDLLLLQLAAANLEEILVVNIYDMVIQQTSFLRQDVWSCRVFKFLTVFGEVTSILFTVLISIFRYQKVKDAGKRVHLPTHLDSVRTMWAVSGACTALALLLSISIFAIHLERRADDFSRNSTNCPQDFFQCSSNNCPLFRGLYKYFFILLCNALPLIIVTGTGCLIIATLLRQRRTLTPLVRVSGQLGAKSKSLHFQRSTVAVLTAMALF